MDHTAHTAKNGGPRRLPKDEQCRGKQQHVRLPHGLLRSNLNLGSRRRTVRLWGVRKAQTQIRRVRAEIATAWAASESLEPRYQQKPRARWAGAELSNRNQGYGWKISRRSDTSSVDCRGANHGACSKPWGKRKTHKPCRAQATPEERTAEQRQRSWL